MAKKTTKTTKKIKVDTKKDDVVIIPMTKQALEAESEPQKAVVSVRTLQPFYDLQAQCNRAVGSQFEVNEDRAKTLENLHLVIVL